MTHKPKAIIIREDGYFFFSTWNSQDILNFWKNFDLSKYEVVRISPSSNGKEYCYQVVYKEKSE